MKKFILICLGVGILSLGIGYGAMYLFSGNSSSNVVEELTPQQEQELKKVEQAKLENLVKTYLFALSTQDWEAIKKISSDGYKEVINKYKETDAAKGLKEYKYDSRAVDMSFEAINSTQSIVSVDYVLAKEGTPIQNTVKMYLSKVNGQWRIVNVE